MNFSVNEMLQWMRCSRQWDLTSQNRKGLVRTGSAPKPLVLGSALHAGLAANAEKQDGLAAVGAYIAEENKRVKEDYAKLVGASISTEELARMEDLAGEAYAIASRYFDYYGHENAMGDDFEWVLVEQTFEVPIPGTSHNLMGTFDGVVRQISTGWFWLVEHKTFGNAPKLDKYETDWQMMSYCWAYEQLFGQPLHGAIYDGISKKFHVKPKDPSEYFIRWKITFPHHAIQEVESHLTTVATQMGSENPAIYPNFRWEGCWDCGVRDLCKAMTLGEDVEFLISTYYRRHEGHGTVKKMSRPRQLVSNISDIFGEGE